MTATGGPVLVIVGPPGAGKSTVGGLVAGALGVTFRDTDDDIVAATGRSIAELFVDDGEAAFRALERDAVRRALAEHTGVLALGGGAVVDPGTRAALRGRTVAFLDVGLAAAAQRVGLNRDRPLLLVNPRATLARMLAERRPWYTEVASVTVATDGRDPASVAGDVVAHVREREGTPR